jgi:hypothetical protein
LVLVPARGDVVHDGIALGAGSGDDLCVPRHDGKGAGDGFKSPLAVPWRPRR